MDTHGWVLWILFPFLFFMFLRRSRSWAHTGNMHRKMKRKLQKGIRSGVAQENVELDRKQDEELDEHRQYIDDLERRVAELENRLDFTERLLAGRREPVAEDPAMRARY